MADKAHDMTDIKLEEMEKRLSAIYSRAKREVGESWKKFLTDSTKEIEKLQKEYEQAKKSGDKEKAQNIGKRLSRAKRERTVKNKRFKELSETVAAELANVNRTALAYINGELPEVYALNYNALKESVDGVGGYSFTLVDAETVKNLATTDKSLLPCKTLNVPKDKRWNIQKLNAEVLQGIIQGESMDEIAKRLSDVIGMNESAAIRNARTIVTGAECKGRQDSYERVTADGIVMKREWIATHDSRTRDAHLELDGQLSDVDGFFENAIGIIQFPGDPHAHPSNVYGCRCTMGAKIIGFKKIRG